MNVLVIWFLVVDESLHASPLLRDLMTMADRNHRITCIFPVIRGVPEIEHKNLKIYVVRLRRLLPIISYLWYCMAALAWLVKVYLNSDVVVFTADVFPLALPWLIARQLGSKHRPIFVVREPSQPVEIHSSHRYYALVLRYLSLRLLLRFSDAVFAISPMHGNEIVAKFKVPAHKVHVWPSSVDTSLFNPEKHLAHRDRLRRELEIVNSFLLIYHGALSNERGLYELVEATRMVREKREDVQLLLLGKGKGDVGRRLRRLVRSSGLDGVVHFRGPVPYSDVPQFIAAADAGVVPLPDQAQWRYQAPTKLLEYLAMGKPVVATDIAAHRWLLENGPTAFYCGDGSPAEIAEAILRCIHTKCTIEETGRDRIAAKFSPVVITDIVLKIFGDLMFE